VRLTPLLLAAALLPCAASAANILRSSTTTQALSAPAPALATEGLPLTEVTGFRVVVSAPAGATLAGGGKLQAYLYNDGLGRWVRNPQLDVTLQAVGRDMVSPDFQVAVPSGRVFFQASAVTVSTGNAVDVRVEGWQL
jgi:hypothetical protein